MNIKSKALPTQQRALRKRDALIDAASSEFARRGFDVATAKSIAASAGVATGTFYQYFNDKSDILREVARQRFDHLQDQVGSLEFTKSVNQLSDQHDPAGIVELFEQTLSFVYDFHAREPELHQILEYRRSLDTQLHAIMNQGERAMQARVLEFVHTFNLANAEAVADNLFAMGEGVIHRHVFFQSDLNINDVIHSAAEMLASFFVTQNRKLANDTTI